VQSTGDVWWRLRDDKVTTGLDVSIGTKFGLVETLLLPPVVPCRLDDRGNVCLVVFVVQGLEDCTLSVLVCAHVEFQALLFFSPLGVSSTYLGRASSFTLGFFSLTFPAGAAAVCFACFSANLRAFSALACSFATGSCQMAGLPILLIRLRTLFRRLLLLGCVGVTTVLTGGILALGILLGG
jgi:hypothetical protein